MSSSGSTSSSRTHSRNAGSKSNQLSAKASDADGSVDDEETDEIRPGKPLRVERLLANLGYGKRKECTVMIKRKQLVYADTGQPAKVRQSQGFCIDWLTIATQPSEAQDMHKICCTLRCAGPGQHAFMASTQHTALRVLLQ
jgi:hypothetical protein